MPWDMCRDPLRVILLPTAIPLLTFLRAVRVTLQPTEKPGQGGGCLPCWIEVCVPVSFCFLCYLRFRLCCAQTTHEGGLVQGCHWPGRNLCENPVRGLPQSLEEAASHADAHVRAGTLWADLPAGWHPGRGDGLPSAPASSPRGTVVGFSPKSCPCLPQIVSWTQSVLGDTKNLPFMLRAF